MSKCPNVRFDTEGLFSNPCSCSQQNISLEDTTKMRMGNSTGFVRMADRDITDFQIANNSARDFENLVGSSGNQFRYYPSTASPKERKTDARLFRNIGYTSPKEWKEIPQRTSGETKRPNPSEKAPTKRREGFTSSTPVDPQPSYSETLFDNKSGNNEQNNSKEGYCGYHQRPSSEMSTTNICCIVAVVILVIIVLGLFIHQMCKRGCRCCQGSCCRECASIVPDINSMIVGGNFPMA